MLRKDKNIKKIALLPHHIAIFRICNKDSFKRWETHMKDVYSIQYGYNKESIEKMVTFLRQLSKSLDQKIEITMDHNKDYMCTKLCNNFERCKDNYQTCYDNDIGGIYNIWDPTFLPGKVKKVRELLKPL